MKHPDFEELIPAKVITNRVHHHHHHHQHHHSEDRKVKFDAIHEYLGLGFKFEKFEEPGVVDVHDRLVQLYFRDKQIERTLNVLKLRTVNTNSLIKVNTF